jgi:hypothetical protein
MSTICTPNTQTRDLSGNLIEMSQSDSTTSINISEINKLLNIDNTTPEGENTKTKSQTDSDSDSVNIDLSAFLGNANQVHNEIDKTIDVKEVIVDADADADDDTIENSLYNTI